MPNHAADKYIMLDPYEMDQSVVDVELRRVRFSKIRSERSCSKCGDKIRCGEYSRVETGLTPDGFIRWDHCVECLDRWIFEGCGEML